MLVPVLDEALDLAAQVSNGVERATTDGFLCDVSEPTFDLIEPRGVSRCVVNVEA